MEMTGGSAKRLASRIVDEKLHVNFTRKTAQHAQAILVLPAMGASTAH